MAASRRSARSAEPPTKPIGERMLPLRSSTIAAFACLPGPGLAASSFHNRQAATVRLLLLNLASTLAMTGIIWFVQVVHYPLFASVGADIFARYEALHATRTGWVVAPLMLTELATSLALLAPSLRPANVSAVSVWIAACLVGVIWLSTALLQVPLHGRLAQGYDAELVARLVATNWIRTVAWTARSWIVLWWMWEALKKAGSCPISSLRSHDGR
jgi:hypothetical protein